MREQEPALDAAKIGKMFVTNVSFSYHEATARWNGSKSEPVPAHWTIGATLRSKASQYGDGQQMTLQVEHGIGQKLVEVLLPVVVADASQKAEQLAADSKAMLQALGERTVSCIVDMQAQTASVPVEQPPEQE